MKLELTDITKILKDRPNKGLVDAAQEYSKKLVMHVTGEGLEGYLEKLDYFEKQELFDIRLKYTRSNKDFFNRLHRPIDKVFSATGGSSYYDLPEEQKRIFVDILGDVEWGHNLRSWIKTFWRTALHCNPMGMVFMEVNEEGETYPTEKSIFSVYDYQLNGRQLDYIVFNTDIKIEQAEAEKKKTYYRVVDDSMDYIVSWDGDTAIIDEERTYENHYGKVPAWIISHLYDPQRGMYISPDDSVIELADQYLREGGILNVFKNNFGFPQRWRYMGDCDVCQGTMHVRGETCLACNGSGKKHKYDVSQDINLPVPTSREEPVLHPPGGNIDVAVESWDKMDSSISTLFNTAYYTKWGVPHAPNVQGPDTGKPGEKSATQVVMDEQPKIEALSDYSSAAEYTEKAIADYMGAFYFGDSYGGADINYGRRFMLEGPDKVMESLIKLIKDEAPYEIVREKMEEYYHTLYQGDSLKLNTALKLIDVEPLPFYSMTKAKNLLSPLEYAKKMYYNDWRGLPSTKAILLKGSVEQLRKSLLKYTIKQANETAAQLPESLKPVEKPVQ